MSLTSPALASEFFTTSATWETQRCLIISKYCAIKKKKKYLFVSFWLPWVFIAVPAFLYSRGAGLLSGWDVWASLVAEDRLEGALVSGAGAQAQ